MGHGGNDMQQVREGSFSLLDGAVHLQKLVSVNAVFAKPFLY